MCAGDVVEAARKAGVIDPESTFWIEVSLSRTHYKCVSGTHKPRLYPEAVKLGADLVRATLYEALHCSPVSPSCSEAREETRRHRERERSSRRDEKSPREGERSSRGDEKTPREGEKRC